MRIICTPLYSATEGFFGVNMDPSLPPEETFYILVPTVAYYEFIPIGALKSTSSPSTKVHPTGDRGGLDKDANGIAASDEQVLDLVSLEVGQQYEILVTTISGYYRMRLDDILEMVSWYNNSPLFKFVRRKNILLSVDHDKTDEEELQVAVRTATLALQKEIDVLRLLEYTSYTDLEDPGHYVIIWELRSTSLSGPYRSDIPAVVLDKCCAALEASLNFIYREGRYEDIIGPLELNIVQPGTFDLLCEYAVSRGASINQYKVPRALSPKQAPLKKIINGKIRQIHFSSTKPPFTPSTYKTKQPRLSYADMCKSSIRVPTFL